MANIFINGLNSKAGGGKVILDNYLNSLIKTNSKHKYFILTPNKNYYSRFESDSITILDINWLFRFNIFFPLLYFFVFPRLFRQNNIEIVFNLGDVIIPTEISQIYFFDWAYAVYSEPHIWEKMSIKDLIVRRVKVFMIKKYINKAKIVIAQTNNMIHRLKLYFNLSNVKLIPTPLGIEFNNRDFYKNYNLPSEKIKFLFPASYSSHKNFDILKELTEVIYKKKLPYVIVLTLNNKDMLSLNKNINKLFSELIINVGNQQKENMPSLYNQCDVLFFPTILESYGLPYIEAMSLSKPIITSDLDFAHDICDDAAFYFNPNDANSILEAMIKVCSNKIIKNKLISAGNKKVENMNNWEITNLEFQKCINILISE